MIASGKWEPDEDGSYFIDRNPKHFNLILDFMRTNKLEVSSLNQKEMEKIKSDFDYYQLPSTLALNFQGNSILSQEHLIQMANWFGDNTSWKLIYRSSRDGANYSNFFNKVNNKGKCVVVVKSSSYGYIFGGYNSFGWSSSNQQKYSEDCFLFTIENPYDIPPTILKMRTTCSSCSNRLNYCPSCGSYNASCDHVRYCQNRCTAIWSIHDTSGIFFGSDLQIPKNMQTASSTFSSYENNTGKSKLFTGSSSFNISEIEVFSVAK